MGSFQPRYLAPKPLIQKGRFQEFFTLHSTTFLVPYSLIFLLFTIPLSTSLQSIGLYIAAGLICFSASYHSSLKQILLKPWCLSIVVLILFAMMATLWSPASSHEKGLILDKYSKFLFLPILAVGFNQERTKRLSLLAFIAAMAVTCCMSLGKQWHLLHYGHGPAAENAGTIFRNHIMTSCMMVIATYLVAGNALKSFGLIRIIYGVLSLIFSYQILFINTSRTGYVMYLVLMLIWFVQSFNWRGVLISFCMASFLIGGAIALSPVLWERLSAAVIEWQNYKKNDKDNSVGFRLQFHDFAAEMLHRHPWLGNGTGAFTHQFAQAKPVPVWNRRLVEPHSQYWLILSEWGGVGFLIYMFLMGSLVYASWELHSMRHLALAVMAVFTLGNLSDSLLLYSGTGYLFVTLMALCLGENVATCLKKS